VCAAVFFFQRRPVAPYEEDEEDVIEEKLESGLHPRTDEE